MASIVVTGGVVAVMNGSIDLDTDAALKFMILQNTYTPNKDHKQVSDINSHELSVSGYTGGFNGAGRKALASKTVTEDSTNDRATFDAADPSTWSALAAGQTAQYLAVIREATNDAGSTVVCILDFGAVILNGGDLTLALNALGALYIQC